MTDVRIRAQDALSAILKPVARNLMPDLRALAGEDFCYLTTKGRLTGSPHEIEMWFALVPESRTLYMLSGGGVHSDWVRNLRRNSEVTVYIAEER
ncbi:MAG TPA: nitroreductase/quinone reductase family protein, partial [Rubrobacter sp.]|nr:nitroreductase/quinone reductase family protein [Rubrobacter sp.]